LVIPPAAPAFAKIPHPDNMPLRFFEQRERLGTAHAVLAAREELAGIGGPILVLYGDTPLVAPESLMRLAQAVARGATVAVMGFRASDPKGYGRLIVDGDATLAAIREEKDATPEEREVTLCNSGIMAFDGKEILNLLYRIENRNKAGEYYLTDAVEIARALGQRVGYEIGEEDEVRGINTRAQLAEVE
jgi:bifunctional UDP-N-acetylglucosamine pyrophosphorylase/glucosamine-1-phosphate N-acetyltransferase